MRSEETAALSAALAASQAELRRVAGRLVAAEEETLRRVARELHDDFGQRLAAVAVELWVMRRKLPAGDPRGADLAAAGASLSELMEDLCRLSHELHPAALERSSLCEVLRDHCEEVERLHGLAVRVSLCDLVGSLPPEVALGLYRIAQEALTNVVRHAGARAAQLTLTVAAGTARLTIADDGVGFDPAAPRAAGLGLTSLKERAVLLGGGCRIASAPGAGTEIEATVPLPAAPPAEPGEAGQLRRHVGPYRLLEEIGRGPLATVYLAEEPPPLGRRVALKLHRGPLPGRRETRRFKAEQQALARLGHPAIAQVYDARTTEEGDLYIVMEHVPGLPITEYCDRHGLTLGRRLALFAAVCHGVQHAHQKGVLHRDLKPSNLLVTEEAGVPIPKIVDFGAAKGLDRPLAEGTLGWTDELPGTPAYLAPEAFSRREIDVRSEVWSLGAVLYELLTGTVPLAVGDAGDAGSESLAGPVGRGERPSGDNVPPPSRRVRSLEGAVALEVARHRGDGAAKRLCRRLAGDLDRLASKALACDPTARYPTVDELAKEVARVLQGEPVEAGPQGALPQLGRQVRRHRGPVAAAALVLVVLTGGLAATAREAGRAGWEASRADATVSFLERLFEASAPRQAEGKVPDARELLRRGVARLGTELKDQPLLRARLLDTLGGIHTELGLFDEARPLLSEALALREREGDPLEIAATLVRLGTLAHRSGKGDAVALFRRALAIEEKTLAPGHPLLGKTRGELARLQAAPPL